MNPITHGKKMLRTKRSILSLLGGVTVLSPRPVLWHLTARLGGRAFLLVNVE